MEAEQTTLLVIALGAFVVPLLSGRIGVPAAVGEIAFGLLVGPYVTGAVASTEFFDFLAEFGFAFLMFLAGLELDFANLERRGGRMLVVSCIVAGLVVGLAFLAAWSMGWPPFFGIIVGAMSIGIMLVALRETGDARSDFGQTLIISGSVGECLAILIFTLYGIASRDGFGLTFVAESLKLLGVFLAAYVVLRTLRLLVWWFPSQFSRMVKVEDPSEIGIRAGLALMIGFFAISESLGMEAILGTFLAGALFSFVFREKGILETKLAGLGHGFLIPVFFIHVGVSLNLDQLDREILPLVAQLLALILLVRLVACLPLFAMGFRLRQIAGGALLLATPLTLLVAIAALGLELGVLNAREVATVILTAAISGLIFPTAFRRLVRRTPGEGDAAAGAALPAAESSARS